MAADRKGPDLAARAEGAADQEATEEVCDHLWEAGHKVDLAEDFANYSLHPIYKKV